jgi:transposase
MQLKRGPQFRRQMTAFRQIAEREAVAGELLLCDQGGIMVKMAAWLPRTEQRISHAEVLTVRTGADCLLFAARTRNEFLWRYNGDHLRRWAAEHRWQLQRWSEDQRYERRPVPALAQRREAAVRKYRTRMESATHEIAAQLAGYAARRRFALVRYNDQDRAYLGDGFPWFRLRSLIAEKLDAQGIELEIVTANDDAAHTAKSPLPRV